MNPITIYGPSGQVPQPEPRKPPEVQWREGHYLIQRVSGADPGFGTPVTPTDVKWTRPRYSMLEAKSIDEIFAMVDDDIIVGKDGPWTVIRIYDDWNE